MSMDSVIFLPETVVTDLLGRDLPASVGQEFDYNGKRYSAVSVWQCSAPTISRAQFVVHSHAPLAAVRRTAELLTAKARPSVRVKAIIETSIDLSYSFIIRGY